MIIGENKGYELETGVYYLEKRIRICGSYDTREELQAACTANSDCIGYSTTSMNIGGEPENGFYPWCLSMVGDDGIATTDANYNYYRKIVDTNGTGITKFGVIL